MHFDNSARPFWGSPSSFAAALGDAARYRAELDRLHVRCHGTPRMFELVQDGVALVEILQHRRRAARLLARAVADASWRPTPITMRRVRLDRPRDLAAFEALDFVVHGVVGQLLIEALEPILSPRLYSYRPGVSP